VRPIAADAGLLLPQTAQLVGHQPDIDTNHSRLERLGKHARYARCLDGRGRPSKAERGAFAVLIHFGSSLKRTRAASGAKVSSRDKGPRLADIDKHWRLIDESRAY